MDQLRHLWADAAAALGRLNPRERGLVALAGGTVLVFLIVLITLSVNGAVNRRKGMDRLVREVARAACRDSVLVVAGACEEEGKPILARWKLRTALRPWTGVLRLGFSFAVPRSLSLRLSCSVCAGRDRDVASCAGPDAARHKGHPTEPDQLRRHHAAGLPIE